MVRDDAGGAAFVKGRGTEGHFPLRSAISSSRAKRDPRRRNAPPGNSTPPSMAPARTASVYRARGGQSQSGASEPSVSRASTTWSWWRGLGDDLQSRWHCRRTTRRYRPLPVNRQLRRPAADAKPGCAAGPSGGWSKERIQLSLGGPDVLGSSGSPLSTLEAVRPSVLGIAARPNVTPEQV